MLGRCRVADLCADGSRAVLIDVDDDCGTELSERVGYLPPHSLSATEHEVSASGQVE